MMHSVSMLAAARRAAVLLAVVLLVPWSPQSLLLQRLEQQYGTQTRSLRLHRFAAGQGLLVGPESLGAGQLAVAETFDQFEDMLAVAAQLSGGPGQ